MCIDLPTAKRYLLALEQLTQHSVLGAFARQTQRELAEPGVAVFEYLEPVVTYPPRLLSFEEQQWRFVAEHQAASCLALVR